MGLVLLLVGDIFFGYILFKHWQDEQRRNDLMVDYLSVRLHDALDEPAIQFLGEAEEWANDRMEKKGK